jgi:hypothetical protein
MYGMRSESGNTGFMLQAIDSSKVVVKNCTIEDMEISLFSVRDSKFGMAGSEVKGVSSGYDYFGSFYQNEVVRIEDTKMEEIG